MFDIYRKVETLELVRVFQAENLEDAKNKAVKILV
jgi:hypothetical protein